MLRFATLALIAPSVALASEKYTIEDLQLEVDLSGLEKVEGGVTERGHRRGHWKAVFDGTPVEVQLFTLREADGFQFDDPSEVLDVISWNRGNESRAKGGPGYTFSSDGPLAGPFGRVPYGWIAVHDVYTGTKLDGHEIFYGGITTDAGYYLEFTSREVFDEDKLDAFEVWAAKSVVYTGETIVPEWTDEEVEERWAASAPDKVIEKGRREILRTDYYIIFTDLGASTARGFAKKVDENYEKVRSVFPFDDMPGQRLLPIFYFSDSPQYYDWCVKNLSWNREQAERSAGVASGDVYATYHKAIGAPVHIHEQTHQIFKNRLRLGGGGSWFQEGVAEYMSSKPAELGEVKRYAKKGTTTPFEEFMVVPSLLMSSAEGSRKEGGSISGGAYTQAAAIIEFVKHSKFGEDAFLDWVHVMGKVGRGDLPAIKRGINQVYGVSLEDFEAEFREYWSKRKMSSRQWHAPADVGKKKRRR